MNTPKPPIDLPNEPIWEPQPRDSRKWYPIFQRYLLAGCKRSKLGIYRAFRAEQRMAIDGNHGTHWNDRRVRCLPNSWNLAFARYRFEERAHAWDRHQSELRREVWEQRFEKFSEQCWQDYESLREQCHVMLANPTAWRLSDLASLQKLAVELGAAAIGEVNIAKGVIERYGGKVVFEEPEDLEIATGLEDDATIF